MPPCKQNNTALTAAITAQKSYRSVEVPLVGVRETPITAMEFTVSWPALYLNENYVFWVIGQWLKDPAKSGDMTQLGLLESFFFSSIFCIPHAMIRTARVACACKVSNSARR